jgi:hypothetical protein
MLPLLKKSMSTSARQSNLFNKRTYGRRRTVFNFNILIVCLHFLSLRTTNFKLRLEVRRHEMQSSAGDLARRRRRKKRVERRRRRSQLNCRRRRLRFLDLLRLRRGCSGQTRDMGCLVGLVAEQGQPSSATAVLEGPLRSTCQTGVSQIKSYFQKSEGSLTDPRRSKAAFLVYLCYQEPVALLCRLDESLFPNSRGQSFSSRARSLCRCRSGDIVLLVSMNSSRMDHDGAGRRERKREKGTERRATKLETDKFQVRVSGHAQPRVLSNGPMSSTLTRRRPPALTWSPIHPDRVNCLFVSPPFYSLR